MVIFYSQNKIYFSFSVKIFVYYNRYLWLNYLYATISTYGQTYFLGVCGVQRGDRRSNRLDKDRATAAWQIRGRRVLRSKVRQPNMVRNPT